MPPLNFEIFDRPILLDRLAPPIPQALQSQITSIVAARLASSGLALINSTFSPTVRLLLPPPHILAPFFHELFSFHYHMTALRIL